MIDKQDNVVTFYSGQLLGQLANSFVAGNTSVAAKLKVGANQLAVRQSKAFMMLPLAATGALNQSLVSVEAVLFTHTVYHPDVVLVGKWCLDESPARAIIASGTFKTLGLVVGVRTVLHSRQSSAFPVEPLGTFPTLHPHAWYAF